MTAIKHFFSLTVYTILTINAIVMTVQYFFGLSSIAEKFFKVVDSVRLVSLL
jgi:hypothetical protein